MVRPAREIAPKDGSLCRQGVPRFGASSVAELVVTLNRRENSRGIAGKRAFAIGLIATNLSQRGALSTTLWDYVDLLAN